MMRKLINSIHPAAARAAVRGLVLLLAGASAVAVEPGPAVPPSAPAGAAQTAAGGGVKVPSETVITATKRLLLDSKGYEATFVGDVKVMDPRFSLNCEKLTAYLKRPPGEGSDGEKDAAPKKQPKAEGGAPGGGVEKAVAEGDVVIVQDKVNDKGQIERSIGRAARAVYDAASGDITLSGWPQVEQRTNTIAATEERTVIILNNKGTMEVLGHSKSVLRNTKTEDGR